MSQCIKTGAIVHFSDYGCVAACDLFEHGDVIIAKLPGPWDRTAHFGDIGLAVTHDIHIGNGYLSKTGGVVVVNKSSVSERLEEQPEYVL